MLASYSKVAIRNLARYKTFSIINIIGLALGLVCCIMIVAYNNYEASYDRFLPGADHIYRAELNALINHSEHHQAQSSQPLAPALVAELPEVAAATRFRNFGAPVLRYQDKVFSEDRFFRADSGFFSVFQHTFVRGDAATAFSLPDCLVLTESMAKKYFGDENPIGKTIVADQRTSYKVTGVIKDLPPTTHFHFDFVVRLSPRILSFDQSWLSNNYYTYFRVREGTDMASFKKKFDALVMNNVGGQVLQAFGLSIAQMHAAGNRYQYELQPLTAIHLNSHAAHELEPNGDSSYLYIFSAIALSVLLMACINFTNLATARSERRAREVGIRKTLGSSRRQIVLQFLAEAVFLSLIAVVVAALLAELLLPLFNEMAGTAIKAVLFGDVVALPLMLLLAVVVGIIAGSYPAFFLSSFRPISVLQGRMSGGNAKSILRSALVVIQFSVSIALIAGTFVVMDQLRFIQNRNLGFNKEQVVVVNKVDDLGAARPGFKEALLQHANVVSASYVTAVPGNAYGDRGYRVEGMGHSDMRSMMLMFSDEDFLRTVQGELAAGRYFSKEHPSDSAAIVLNEAAVSALGLTDPVGKRIVSGGGMRSGEASLEIIGVVKDFNFESMHQKIRPLAIQMFDRFNQPGVMAVRIAPGNIGETVHSLESTWSTMAAGEAFDYSFLDQHIGRMYAAEQRTAGIATLFSGLAIVIACLGLIGLAAFVTERRTKEIGIRKVLGASQSGIMMLLTKEFIGLVLIANLVAWPAAWFIMNKWLQEFAYSVHLGPLVFLVSGLAAVLIAIVVVGFQTLRAAGANPVDALKYE